MDINQIRMLDDYKLISDMLLHQGFRLADKEGEDEFIFEEKNQQTMIINNQQITRDIVIEHHIQYIGDGWRANVDESNKEILFGFECFDTCMNQTSQKVNIWAKNWNEFVELIQKR